ncbi:polysaccharide biosynthesis/export family protein [Alteromonas macleodii]|jgi:polysaccharide biosynthesis/export protein VpsN|uniref:polysaccharide biosynthesis/export family protein n=1 Tax=Alteromonas macleodii TaxID=28108 RepID=UPI003648CD3F|tara:strand:- start:2747 stop:3283 length:537 start_codon:yes stop_codon:yes gene_type:complete
MQRFVVLCALFISFFAASVLAQSNSLDQYRLGSGDVVKITVYGQDDLSLETRLSDVGIINYPYLGEIKLVGLTLPELESYIYNGLKGDYLIEPSVSVSITDYRPFFINGEVKKPGGYPYQPGLTIDKAAALAGGYTERASKTKIFIVRDTDGSSTTISVDRSGTVLPGDIVTIEQSFF